jgi:tripartite-type tricarboxylate transporter receptor subunit TctC
LPPALAVIGKQRSQQLPNGPTVAESGLPGFENTGWFGFLAPAGTPPVGNTAAELANAMDAESRLWATVVKNRNIITNCHEEKTDEN